MEDLQTGLKRDSFDTEPIAPLGIIAMPGCEMLGGRINEYLMRWRNSPVEEKRGEENPTDLITDPGYSRDDYRLDISCPRFDTGEGKGLLRNSVRGYDLYILSDVTAYQVRYNMRGESVPMSPDDHYADLKRIIAAVGGKAHRINVVMPFLYESRQHRRTSRESMDCAVMLQELTNMGVDNIITFDAHDPRVQNAIPLTGFESIHPTYQMLKALLRRHKDLNISKDSMMVVSPDEGAISRNIYYSTVLGLDLGMFYKQRDYTQVIDGRNPIKRHEYIGEDVTDKDIIVADDIIATGDSILDLAIQLKQRKAKRIFVASTFAFFTKGLEKFNQLYERGDIAGVLGTNLTYLPSHIREAKWFIEVDMSKYISFIIATLNHDHSLNGLLNPLERIKKLLDGYRVEQVKAGDRLA